MSCCWSILWQFQILSLNISNSFCTIEIMIHAIIILERRQLSHCLTFKQRSLHSRIYLILYAYNGGYQFLNGFIVVICWWDSTNLKRDQSGVGPFYFILISSKLELRFAVANLNWSECPTLFYLNYAFKLWRSS